MCTVLLPSGGYQIAVNKYISYHISYHIISYIKCVFRIFSATYFWNISHPKESSASYFHNRAQVLMYSTRYYCYILDRFSKSTQIPNIMKTPPVEAELVMRANGQTDMT